MLDLKWLSPCTSCEVSEVHKADQNFFQFVPVYGALCRWLRLFPPMRRANALQQGTRVRDLQCRPASVHCGFADELVGKAGYPAGSGLARQTGQLFTQRENCRCFL
jgi:hypothetical protein